MLENLNNIVGSLKQLMWVNVQVSFNCIFVNVIFIFFHRGATSEVYKVIQKGTKNEYAMKKIKKNV